MRTTENLTVSLPPAIKRDMERAAKKENRTMSELIRETWRQYRRPTAPDIYQLIRQMAPTPPEMRAMQNEAGRQGTDKLTMAQIQREVRAVRNRHDGRKSGKRNRK